MKYLLFFLLLPVFSSAQNWTKVAGRWEYQFMRHDSLLRVPLIKLSTADNGSIAAISDTIFFKDHTGTWVPYGKAVQINDTSFMVGADLIRIHFNTGGGGGTPGGSNRQIQFNNVGAFAGGPTYSTTNTINTDSVRSKRNQSDTIIGALWPTLSLDTVYILGDSYAVGVGATDVNHYWFNRLCGWLGLPGKSFAISGSTLEKRSPTNPYGGSNGIDMVANVPIYGPKKGWVIIALGLNDVGYNNANYTPANYRIDYQTIITYLTVTLGWPANRIIILGAYYASPDTYSAYNSITGTPLVARQRHIDFIDSAQATAVANGTMFVNPFAAELANDSSLLITGNSSNDNVHPNDFGHAIIAQAVYTTIIDTVKRNAQILAINGKSELQSLYLKNTDTIPDYSAVLGQAPDGRIGFFNQNKIVHTQSLYAPQAGNINMVGKGLFGAVSSTVAAYKENLITNGGIHSDYISVAGSLPGGLTGTAVRIALVGSYGYVGDPTITSLLLNPFGSVVMGTLSASGSATFQLTGNMGITSGKLRIGDLSTPTMPLEVISPQAMLIPYGTNAQRPAGVAAYVRANSDCACMEYYDGTTWQQLSNVSASARKLTYFSSTVNNTSTTETDLYSYTIPANTLTINGNTIVFDVDGSFNDATTTNAIGYYWGGTSLMSTGGVTITGTNGGWNGKIKVTRASSTTAVVTVDFRSGLSNTPMLLSTSTLSGLDFTITNTIKFTGTASGAGASTGDISANQGIVIFYP